MAKSDEWCFSKKQKNSTDWPNSNIALCLSWAIREKIRTLEISRPLSVCIFMNFPSTSAQRCFSHRLHLLMCVKANVTSKRSAPESWAAYRNVGEKISWWVISVLLVFLTKTKKSKAKIFFSNYYEAKQVRISQEKHNLCQTICLPGPLGWHWLAGCSKGNLLTDCFLDWFYPFFALMWLEKRGFGFGLFGLG